MLLWAICIMMIGDGMLMIRLREAIGLEIKTQFTTCVKKHPKPFLSFSHMDFHSQELKTERSINVLSEVNHLTTENVKAI